MERLLKQIGIIIIGIGLLLISYLLLKPVKESNENKIALKKYEEVILDLDSVLKSTVESDIIVDKFKGFNKNKEHIAYLYEATSSNSYGSITIILAVNLNGKVIGMKALDVNQTLHVDLIIDKINNYRDNVDGVVDGLTGVTYAKDTINDILKEISEDLKGGK